MRQLLRALRRSAAGHTGPERGGELFARQRAAFDRAVVLVQMFYAANLLWACWRISNIDRWDTFEHLQPLWPLFWADGWDVGHVATLVLLVNVAGAVVGCFWPLQRWARVVAAVGLLLAGALDNSFGRIGHSGHAWLWVAACLIFLPTATNRDFSQSRVLRHRYLQLFWTAQFVVLFFYSMAGVLKLLPVPIQLLQGEACSLSPDALARHVASRSLQTDSNPLLARLLIDHIAISWPLYLGALYLETTAIIAAFRPALHRLWGCSLALLHIGIGLAMDIWFVPPVFLAALLLVNSPLAPLQTDWLTVLRQLPGVALTVRMFSQRTLLGRRSRRYDSPELTPSADSPSPTN